MGIGGSRKSGHQKMSKKHDKTRTAKSSDVLGKGTFGTVKKTQDKNGRDMAMKNVDLDWVW